MGPLDWQPDRRTSLQPDLLVVHWDRIGERNISGTPALVVDVLSPGTARIDSMVKSSRYADGGIGHCWVVDPSVPSVKVFTLTNGDYELTASGTGDTAVSVTEPVAVTVIPGDLVGV